MNKVNFSLNWTIRLPGIPLGLSEMIATYSRVSVELTGSKDVTHLTPLVEEAPAPQPRYQETLQPFLKTWALQKETPSFSIRWLLEPAFEFMPWRSGPDSWGKVLGLRSGAGDNSLRQNWNHTPACKEAKNSGFLHCLQVPHDCLFPGKNPPVCFISSPNEQDSGRSLVSLKLINRKVPLPLAPSWS